MLILSRKVGDVTTVSFSDVDTGQTLVSMEITVIEVKGNKVRLGFDAPLSVHILRQEALIKEKKVS